MSNPSQSNIHAAALLIEGFRDSFGGARKPVEPEFIKAALNSVVLNCVNLDRNIVTALILALTCSNFVTKYTNANERITLNNLGNDILNRWMLDEQPTPMDAKLFNVLANCLF